MNGQKLQVVDKFSYLTLSREVHIYDAVTARTSKAGFAFCRLCSLKVAKSNATKTPLKPRCMISIFQLSPGNRLHTIEEIGVASSEKEQLSMKQRESVKLKESAQNTKQEPRNHHQSHYSPSSLALFATDSLELKLD